LRKIFAPLREKHKQLQEKTIIYKNINISYTDSGKGNVIVLLHGFLENQSMWQDIISVLTKKNRVITIDLLGHGKTENLSYVHSMSDQAKMIKSVLDSLRLRRYYLIGHSLGGYISLAFTELYPKNTKGICLMNSTAKPDASERKQNRDRAIAMVKRNKDTFIKMAIPNLFTQESRINFKKEIDVIKTDALKTSIQGVIASLEGMKNRKDRTFILQNIEFKKMLIIGKKDPLLNRDELINQVKNTNTEIVEFSTGHMSHIENKKELITTLLNFVK